MYDQNQFKKKKQIRRREIRHITFMSTMNKVIHKILKSLHYVPMTWFPCVKNHGSFISYVILMIKIIITFTLIHSGCWLSWPIFKIKYIFSYFHTFYFLIPFVLIERHLQTKNQNTRTVLKWRDTELTHEHTERNVLLTFLIT